MREFEPPDSHYFNAAMGWLELGNAAEAAGELERISASNREHPMVLELRWRIEATRRDWEQALLWAGHMRRVDPANVSGWINEAYSLHELKRTQEAMDRLLPVARRFPEVPTVPYNLACYACQLGNRGLAWEWLEKAVALLGKERVKQMARSDPDLAALRDQIEHL